MPEHVEPGKLKLPGSGYTEPGEYFVEAGLIEMDAMADHFEMREYAPRLISDLANIAAGGRIVEFEEEASSSDSIMYSQILKIISELVSISQLPGRTPLARAFVCYQLLDAAGVLGQLGLNSGTKSAVDKASEAVRKFGELGDLDKDLLDENEGGEEEEGKGDLEGAKKAVKVLRRLMKGDLIWVDIDRKLDKSETFRAHKTIQFIPDTNGDEIRTRPIADFSEIPRLVATEYSYPAPMRAYRLISQSASIRERGWHKDRKQLLFLLVDSTGSMGFAGANGISNAQRAGGIVYNRIKAVLRGDAEVYLQFFDTRLCGPTFVLRKKEEAVEFVRKYKLHSFSGGGTNILNAVTQSVGKIKEIRERDTDLVTPDLILVSDGQDDSSGLNASFLLKEDIRLHYFEVSGNAGVIVNPRWAQVARDTGGILATI